MKNGNVMGFRGYRFFSPKSSNAKNSTLGTSEANFGGKKPRIILREVRYSYSIQNFSQLHLAVLEKIAILLVLLFLVIAAILNSQPD